MGCIRDKPMKNFCEINSAGARQSGLGTGMDSDEEDVVIETGPYRMLTDFTHKVVDPRVPLTVRQVFSLNQSWRAIRRNITETGVEFFIQLFKQSAELKQMFSNFKHLESEDDLRTNEALEHHATLVMMTIDDAITHIDNYDYIIDALQKAAISHLRFIGFKPEYFWKVHDPFLEAVKVTLGDRLTENMEAIYKVALTFILQTMVEGMSVNDTLQVKVPEDGQSVDSLVISS